MNLEIELTKTLWKGDAILMGFLGGALLLSLAIAMIQKSTIMKVMAGVMTLSCMVLGEGALILKQYTEPLLVMMKASYGTVTIHTERGSSKRALISHAMDIQSGSNIVKRTEQVRLSRGQLKAVHQFFQANHLFQNRWPLEMAEVALGLRAPKMLAKKPPEPVKPQETEKPAAVSTPADSLTAPAPVETNTTVVEKPTSDTAVTPSLEPAPPTEPKKEEKTTEIVPSPESNLFQQDPVSLTSHKP